MNDRILIDSHILIWYLYEPENLSQQAKDAILSSRQRYFSIVSLWELTIKHKKHKLAYKPSDIVQNYKKVGLELLNLSEEHLQTMLEIKLSHKDPFDELLIAQSKSESLPLLTADKLLIQSKYKTIQA